MLGLALWTGTLTEGNSGHLIAELIFCAVVAIGVFVPSLYLHKSVGHMSIFLAQGHIVQLESVLESQRKFWRFAGTVALVWLICLAVSVIGIMARL
jgi:hypothetical protein